MEIICNQQLLLGAINTVLKAVSSKTSYPILECILIETDNDDIRLTANDNDFCIETVIEGTVNRAGKIALNARMLSDLVRKLPADDVIITTDERFQTTIVCGKAKFTLHGDPGDEFPKPLPYDNENPVVISQFTLKEIIRQTIFSISDNESQRIMTGEYLEINGNHLRLTALDGYRISIRNVELRGNYEPKNAIVPGKVMNEIGKILGGDMDKDVRICFDERNIILEMDKTTVRPNTELEFTVKEMLVYVGGAVARIGQVEYNPSWHAIDYIAAAGINTISGTWSQVKVWRGNKPDALSVSVTEDPILPGDYIEIPKSRYEAFKDFTLFLASLLTVVSSAFIIYASYNKQ